MDRIERTLKIGEMRLASILCDLEEYLAQRFEKKEAENLVNKVEAQVLEKLRS